MLRAAMVNRNVIECRGSLTPSAGGRIDEQLGLRHWANGWHPHYPRSIGTTRVPTTFGADQPKHVCELFFRVRHPAAILRLPCGPVVTGGHGVPMLPRLLLLLQRLLAPPAATCGVQLIDGARGVDGSQGRRSNHAPDEQRARAGPEVQADW